MTPNLRNKALSKIYRMIFVSISGEKYLDKQGVLVYKAYLLYN
jgi:hypothetical protein